MSNSDFIIAFLAFLFLFSSMAYFFHLAKKYFLNEIRRIKDRLFATAHKIWLTRRWLPAAAIVAIGFAGFSALAAHGQAMAPYGWGPALTRPGWEMFNPNPVPAQKLAPGMERRHPHCSERPKDRGPARWISATPAVCAA